jgi:hypothetical protein
MCAYGSANLIGEIIFSSSGSFSTEEGEKKKKIEKQKKEKKGNY